MNKHCYVHYQCTSVMLTMLLLCCRYLAQLYCKVTRIKLELGTEPHILRGGKQLRPHRAVSSSFASSSSYIQSYPLCRISSCIIVLYSTYVSRRGSSDLTTVVNILEISALSSLRNFCNCFSLSLSLLLLNENFVDLTENCENAFRYYQLSATSSVIIVALS